MLTPIEKITPLAPIAGEKKAQDVSSQIGESVFGAVFRSAIEDVKETDADYKEAQYLLSTGQLDNPAAAMIAGSKSVAAVNLLIQLRNKALEAYNSLITMSM